MVITNHRLRNAGDIFFNVASSQPIPPTAKKIEPLAISLLNAEDPTRLSELKARIGEPRWSIEAMKPMPINTHSPNMQAITRCCDSGRKSPFINASARTIKPPTTHCPKTVKIISGHSCHPLPILHLLRIGQITCGIPGRAAIGVRFDDNTRFGKVRAR